MTGTSNTNNQGIIHLTWQFGGKTFCGQSRAIMATIPSEAHKWPRICARCQSKLDQTQKRIKRLPDAFAACA